MNRPGPNTADSPEKATDGPQSAPDAPIGQRAAPEGEFGRETGAQSLADDTPAADGRADRAYWTTRYDA